MLTGLERAHYRVLAVLSVLAGMSVLGVVTASDVSTGETETQMHPCVPHLETLATALPGWRDILDRSDVWTVLLRQ
jgi:hypothetical protein